MWIVIIMVMKWLIMNNNSDEISNESINEIMKWR